MPTYSSLWPTYAKQWDQASTLASKQAEIAHTAKRLVAPAAKARYQAVEKKTGVPRGQGPYYGQDAWERSAIVALERKEAGAAANLTKVKDWRLEKILYWSEAYNGWGPHNHGIPSGYIWGGTSIQKRGKYTSDGHWDPNAWDQQLGCAAILKGMMDFDHTIKPIREEGKSVVADAPVAPWWKVW